MKLSWWRTVRRQFRVAFGAQEPLVIRTKQPDKTSICQCGKHWASIDSAELVSIFSAGGMRGADSRPPVPLGGRQEALRGRAQTLIALDCEGRRLAVSAHEIVAVYALDADFRIVRRIGRLRLPGQSPRWLALTSDRLSLLAENSETFSMESQLLLGSYRVVANQAVQTIPVFELAFGTRPQIRARPERADHIGLDERPPWNDRAIELRTAAYPLAVSFDHQHIAIGLKDLRVALVDLRSGTLSFDSGHEAPINFVGFPGDRLASADQSGRLIVRDSIRDDANGHSFVVSPA